MKNPTKSHGKSHEINEFLGVNAGPMNALTADGLVASLKALEGPRGERCANNARDFAAKVKAGLGTCRLNHQNLFFFAPKAGDLTKDGDLRSFFSMKHGDLSHESRDFLKSKMRISL